MPSLHNSDASDFHHMFCNQLVTLVVETNTRVRTHASKLTQAYLTNSLFWVDFQFSFDQVLTCCSRCLYERSRDAVAENELHSTDQVVVINLSKANRFQLDPNVDTINLCLISWTDVGVVFWDILPEISIAF